MFLEQLNQLLASRKSFISDRLNVLGFGFSLLINIIHWLILLIKIKPGSENILLHYNVVYGPDFVERASFIYIIPLIALVFLIINLILSNFYYDKEKTASVFLTFATIAVQLVFLAASIILVIANQ
ncbi:MAG: hypothetical protein HY545_00695 [Candidatus Doudnabacteria bacterium]|nr:hypothetical protein [Candidatus Doudnabacteria bacterium]